MTVTGPQKLNGLHKQHLVYLGNTMFNADPPLDMSKHNKQQLYDIVANAMMELQECTICPDGNCSPDTHVFQEAQYNPPSSTPAFGDAMTQLNNTPQQDIDLANARPFLGGQQTEHDAPIDPEDVRDQIVGQAGATLPNNSTNQGIPLLSFRPPTDPNPPMGGTPLTRNAQQISGNPHPTSEPAVLELLKQQQETNNRLVRLLEQNMRPAPTQSNTVTTAPTSSRISVVALQNPENAQFMGLNVPPMLSIMDDVSNVDMSKIKGKMKSGADWTGETVCLHMTAWPQQCLNPLFINPPPRFDNLTPTQYFTGSVGKFLSEMDPNLKNSQIENQMKFLGLLGHQAMVMQWSDILALSKLFYRTIEAGSMDWSDWSRIEAWWQRSLDAFKARSASGLSTSSITKRATTTTTDSEPQTKTQRTTLYGLKIDWMRNSYICIRFQHTVQMPQYRLPCHRGE